MKLMKHVPSSLVLLPLLLLLLSLITTPGQCKSAAAMASGECQVFAPELPKCSSNCAAFCTGVYRGKLLKSACVEHDQSLCSCFIRCSAPPSPVTLKN
ncbi:hypothetical protein H6P81_017470 [Aristolochia fimbriata]|uniref:Uncharacterized protein n=1 Tax=Aristolochia fimbriata TaxID=158543 RepID=A0AAV7E1C1_ARIFI|nr:hypothetical protein H6P81_017470 [Aristolochia fimbriata]